jgi:hypothetical protein
MIVASVAGVGSIVGTAKIVVKVEGKYLEITILG